MNQARSFAIAGARDAAMHGKDAARRVAKDAPPHPFIGATPQKAKPR
jgi:hypothetical protein